MRSSIRQAAAAIRQLLEPGDSAHVGRRFAGGAFWSLAGAVISRVFMLAASILVARRLGGEAFGEFGVIFGTVGMFSVLSNAGLGITATRYVAELRVQDPNRAGRILGLSTVVTATIGISMGVALVAFAPWLARHTLAAPQLADFLRIASLMLVFNAMNGMLTGALAGFGAFRTMAKLNLLGGVAYFPLLVGGVYWAGLEGGVWGMCASAAINWGLSYFAVRAAARRAGVPITYAGLRRELPLLGGFSLPAVLSSSMVAPANWVCMAMLVNEPNGYIEMGIFNAANQWRLAILFVPTAIAPVVLSLLADLRGAGDPLRYRRMLRHNFVLNGAVALAVGVPAVVLSPLIMASYGPAFESHYSVLIVLAIAAAITAMCTVVGQAIVTLGRMWNGFALNAAWAVVLILSTHFLAPYGAIGLASAIFLAYGVHLLTTWAYARFILGKSLSSEGFE